MNTVFEPTILFISDDEWQHHEKRDKFLCHLLDHLMYIDEHRITRIYWTDELEEILWNDPRFPPWRKDKDWHHKIVPVIYKRFNNCKELLELSGEAGTCFVEPAFICECCKREAHICYMNLMYYAIRNDEPIYLCVGVENRLSGRERYLFCIEGNTDKFQPDLINNPDEWLEKVDLVTKFWPCEYSDKEIAKFRKALEITARLRFSESISDGFLYEYEFDKRFITKIIKENRHRVDLLNSVSKRLLLHQKAATSDGGLRDEPVMGTAKVRRFRVTGSSRVHYSYSEAKKKIEFLSYYGEGEHDKGLQ